MIAAIVAVNEDWGIGYGGDLLEHIPEDLKYFKKITKDSNVVMGLLTWMSLPKKPLPDRRNIVLDYVDANKFEFVCTDENLETAVDLMNSFPKESFFIIGGGSIYKQLLPYCDRVYVTKIHKSHENVDTYFPNLDNMSEWHMISYDGNYTYNDISYAFTVYEKN